MMKWMITGMVALVFLVGPAAQAADDDKGAEKAAKMFAKLDKDSDGKVTLEEFKALAKGDDAKAKGLEKRFKKIDADNDGSLSKDEFAKGMSKKGGKKKKKKDGDGDK